MTYSALLHEYIRRSGLTLEGIAGECARRGVSVHPTYISKLRLGKRPAPAPDITRTLAEVTGGDAERLLAAASEERMTAEHKESYERAVKSRLAVELALDRMSGGGSELLPAAQEKVRELFGELAGRLAERPITRDLWTNRRKLGEALTDPALDSALLADLLERLEAIAGSPEVLFEKWKASAMESGRDVAKLLSGESGLETYPVGHHVRVPIIGTVTAGPNGTAYEDHEGEEWADEKDVKGGGYFYLRVKGDSMTGDGILPNDLALVRETPEVDYGDIAVVVVDGEEGTLKRVFRTEGSIMLQSSNPAYPPRVFHGSDMGKVRIVGKVKQTIRRY